MLESLRAPFPTEKVYQREGPGGKQLDYVSGETVIERLLDAAPGYSWNGEIISIAEGKAVVSGTITVILESGDRKIGFGVGSSKMGADLDSSLKAANTEAIKNAAKNGFGIALELWNADHRDDLARRRKLTTPAARKAELFKLARTRLEKDKPTAAEIAKLFKVKAGDLSDDVTVSAILEQEGLL